MMVVTAASSLLGSSLVGKLNQQNFNYIVAANPAGYAEEPLRHSKLLDKIQEADLPAWLAENHRETEFVFLIDDSIYISDDQSFINFLVKQQFNQEIWQLCADHQLPLLYLSYTNGTEKAPISQENPFLAWAQAQARQPFFWAALTLPEVYGPGEPKQGQASVVYRAYQAWQQGEESFQRFVESALPQRLVHVHDVVEVCYFLVHHRRDAGVYEVGPEQPYTGQQIAQAMAAAMGPSPVKEATEAPPVSLQTIGFNKPFFSLKAGIGECVRQWKR